VTVSMQSKSKATTSKVPPPAGDGARTSAILTLAETQTLFQQAILAGDQRVMSHILDNSRTGRAELFGVYRNAYSGRLTEIVAADYEFLKAYMGEHDFDGLARAYITAYPSQTQNARWFSARLPAFLRADPGYADRPTLADLADLEKALADAFDAPDDATITIAELAQHVPEDWGRLTLKAHPSVKLLTATTDVFALWMAMRDDASAPPEVEGAQRRLIVWRHEATPMVRELGAEEAMMWIEASRGARFDALCEMAALYDAPDNAAMRAAGYLQGWLASDMLIAARLATDAEF
jgi:Putative DNA-binding domain